MANHKVAKISIKPTIRQISPNAIIPPQDGKNLSPEKQIAQLGVEPDGMAAEVIKLGGQIVAITPDPNSPIKQ